MSSIRLKILRLYLVKRYISYLWFKIVKPYVSWHLISLIVSLRQNSYINWKWKSETIFISVHPPTKKNCLAFLSRAELFFHEGGGWILPHLLKENGRYSEHDSPPFPPATRRRSLSVNTINGWQIFKYTTEVGVLIV